MRVLVITRGAWCDNNNSGSTMSNFFSDMPSDCSFYSLYCRSEAPNNRVAEQSFQISEYALLKNMLSRKPVGGKIDGCVKKEKNNAEQNIYQKGRQMGKGFVRFCREMIWSFGNWKTKALDDFLEEVKPDILFMMAFDSIYPYKILRYVQKKTGAAVVLFHADTNYTLKQFSLSPFFWGCRLVLRKYVRRAIETAALNYSITQTQCEAYEKKFHKPFYLLTKSESFEHMPALPAATEQPLQLVYTGNLDNGRARSLLLLVEALREINQNKICAQLHIYCGIVQNPHMISRFCVPGISFFHGAIPVVQIPRVQSEADILVYTEGLDLQSRLKVQQSFSSKLVDYFSAARCILAIGPADVASVEHLVHCDAAVVASKPSEVLQKLKLLLENESMRTAYAKKAWQCGAEHHNSKKMKAELYKQLSALSAAKESNAL